MFGFQPKSKRAASAEGEQAPQLGLPGKRAQSRTQAQAPQLGFPGKRSQSAGQAQALNQAPDSIPGMFKPGEFVLPPDTVHALGGKEALGQVVDATHTPAPAAAVVPGGFQPRAYFANGGAPEDSLRKNSFGDAAAAASNPGVTQVQAAPAPAPKPVQEPAPAPAQPTGAQMATPPSSPAEKPVSPTNTFPQASPSAGANVYGGAAAGAMRAGANSFGDAAAASLDSRVSQIPTGGAKAPAADGSQEQWRNTELGRNANNAMMALPGVGGLGRIAATGGAISTGLNAASSGVNAASRMAAFGAGVTASGTATPAAASAPAPNPYANVTPEQGRAMAEINAKVQPPAAGAPGAPAPSAAQQLTQQPDGYGAIGDRTKLTNEQAATMNPAGRVTATRGANGTMEFSGNNVSGQVSYNDASGKVLAGGGLNGKGFSGFDVASAGANVVTGPNGSYAFSTTPGANVPSSGAANRGSAAASSLSSNASAAADNQAWHERGRALSQQAQGGSAGDQYAAEVRQAQAINQGEAQRRGSWDSRVAQWNDPFSGVGKARRNMEVSMNAMTPYHQRGKGGAGEKLAAARQAAYGELAKQHFGMAPGDRDDATRRYASDNSLQGTQVQQQGATAREQMQEVGRNSRFGQEQGLAQQKFGMEREAQGFSNRAAAQSEQLRNVLLDPKATPEQRKVAQRSLAALSGKTAADRMQTVNLPDTTTDIGAVVRGGQALVRTLEDGTVEQVPIGGQQPGQGGAQPSANHLAALRANPKQADFFDQVYGKGAAARILGGR